MIANKTVVRYDTGKYRGTAEVVGVATTHNPDIGYIYILEDIGENFPNDDYPYQCFACPESLLTIWRK